MLIPLILVPEIYFLQFPRFQFIADLEQIIENHYEGNKYFEQSFFMKKMYLYA